MHISRQPVLACCTNQSSRGQAQQVTAVRIAKVSGMPCCVAHQPKASVPSSSDSRSMRRNLALLAASAPGLSLPACKPCLAPKQVGWAPHQLLCTHFLGCSGGFSLVAVSHVTTSKRNDNFGS